MAKIKQTGPVKIKKLHSARRSITAGDKKTPPYLICIGASAGGVNAVMEIVAQLPPKLNAAVFILLHISTTTISELLVERMRRQSALDCSVAKDKEHIIAGHIYIAPADVHLLVKDGQVIYGHGPHENRFRPSIDVLFRSAAVAYGERTIGIILTGYLNDGTIGMWNIKQCGGHTIVQDPAEAEFPDMPTAVLEKMKVDHSLPLAEIGEVVTNIIRTYKIRGIKPPPQIVAESSLSERTAAGI
ncbi:MAG TPA: chemotaxis protein CheB, partial [Chitinophagaceae bacterium]|nr:chemotaxis protein CheB [Chitinophagaceae bacterium]